MNEEDFELVSYVPMLKRRHYACVICGWEGKQDDVVAHVHHEHLDEDIMRFGLAKKSQLEVLILKTKPLEKEMLKESLDCKTDDEVSRLLFTVTTQDWATLKHDHPLSSNLVGAFVNAIDFWPQKSELCGINLQEYLR